MWEIVKICIFLAVVIVLLYFALKGMKRLWYESDARSASKSNSDVYIKHGFDLDEQEKRRTEENR